MISYQQQKKRNHHMIKKLEPVRAVHTKKLQANLMTKI